MKGRKIRKIRDFNMKILLNNKKSMKKRNDRNSEILNEKT